MLRSPWTTFSLVVLICLSQAIAESNVKEADSGDGEAGDLVPLMEDGGKMEMIPFFNETRRKLGSFQICAVCTCCGGARGVCLPSPCCYAINCNIPNRPFGFCAFTPKTCNCFGCHL
ncbi:hypothetical protein MLD38_016828 [Melastoma candidum]|uniref:Uncharacterized protein n=1 Tax=Melastoma candidum TaxID=119954 RepID=A0ACB9QPZ2_9MYRT|nr:hypothetical protein MLD38_016828 [Melastoma candidum]